MSALLPSLLAFEAAASCSALREGRPRAGEGRDAEAGGGSPAALSSRAAAASPGRPSAPGRGRPHGLSRDAGRIERRVCGRTAHQRSPD